MKALLLGGPVHWKTVELPEGAHELYVPVPTRPTGWIDPREPVPMDLQVARYVVTDRLWMSDRSFAGLILEYRGTH